MGFSIDIDLQHLSCCTVGVIDVEETTEEAYDANGSHKGSSVTTAPPPLARAVPWLGIDLREEGPDH
jgi:hypothetical protein